MSKASAEYPFVPRSNKLLRAGQFWAIRLSDGRYAAGRVTRVPAFGPTDRTGLVMGLMDWSGDDAPTESDLVGRRLLAQAASRYDAIGKNGGQVLGLRALELDGIVPLDPNDLSVGSVHRVWGWRRIVTLAEEAFVPKP